MTDESPSQPHGRGPTELVVFDVNETLSDTSSMRQAFASVGLDAGAAEAWFAGVLRDGFALTAAGAKPAFAEVASQLLHVRLAEAGVESPGAVEQVMAAFTSLPVHPDVTEGIGALREAGFRVVTLSNGSASVAEGLLDRAGVADSVERTLSVDDAPAWKPHRSAYAYALEACGVPAERTALVAVHPWDVDGASRARLRTVWLNRTASTYPEHFSAPDVEVADLRELATALR